MRSIVMILSFVASGLLAIPVSARQDKAPEHKHASTTDKSAPAAPVAGSDADVIRAQAPSYPLMKCVSSGDVLGTGDMKPVDYVIKGRLVRLCCADCKKDVDKDPAATFKKIDDAVIAAQKPTYPLMTDPVSDAALGKDAIDYVYGTRLVRFASKDSIAAFEKEPAPYLAKVDKALIEAQIKTYPLKTCVVTGEAFGGDMGDPINYIYGTRLVRFCCKACPKKFEADPAKFLAKIDEAAKKDSKSDH